MATIAVLDGEVPILDLVRDLLTDEGHQVYGYCTTADAEAAIAADCPDLLILDLFVAVWDDGWHLLKRLRACPATARMPVIVTTVDESFERERADELVALGCAVLPKPFDLDDLVALVAQGASTTT